MKRIPAFKTLDIFRGVAALWVVMDHSCDRWLGNGNLAYLNNPVYRFSLEGKLGVTLFFVISGYCIVAAAYSALHSGKTLGRYAFERVRRIYPPYLAALILTVLSQFFILFANSHHLIGEVHHLAALPHSPRFWIANLLLLQSELNTPMVNVVFWSLCYEVVFYVFIGVFLQAAKWLSVKYGLMAGTKLLISCVGVSAVLALVQLLATGKPFFPFDLWYQFALGGLLFFLLELKPETVSNYTRGLRVLVLANILPLTVVMVLVAIYRQIGEAGLGKPSTALQIAVCLLFAASLLLFRRADDAIASHRIMLPVIWLGSFSYSLYLAHPIVLPYVDILCRKLGMNGSYYFVAFLLQIAVAAAFSRIFFLLVESRFISKRQKQRLAPNSLDGGPGAGQPSYVSLPGGFKF